ncbi:MAG: hypothetical protein K0U41_02255 [Gammaproteobacteria bacterium]|nr:hypothetical protein [Gammaproteobacteria bacterium]
MAGFPPVGRSGGGAEFALGPEQNTFDGVDRTTAEAARDTYATNNPVWLAQYDADSGIGIYLTYIDGGSSVISTQVRLSGQWRDSVTFIALQGISGSGTDFAAVSDNHIPAIGAAPDKVPYDSGMRVIQPDGTILAPGNFGVEGQSIGFGDLITLSEVSGFLATANKSRASGEQFALVDSRFTKADGSFRPQIFELTEGENAFVAQPDDTQVITTNPLIFNYTPSPPDAQINSATFRVQTGQSMANTRIKVVDVASGISLKYIPSKAAWLDGTGGVTFNAGDVVVDLGTSQLRFIAGQEIQVEIRADSVHLLGNASGTPYFAVMEQEAQLTQIPYTRDIPTMVVQLTDVTSAGSGAIITNDERTKLSGIATGAEVNVQADWGEANIASDGFIQNKPIIPTPRTDEEIRDVVGMTLVAGMGVTITVNDAADTITINATGGSGGGTPSPAANAVIYFGLMGANEPGIVDISTLTDEGGPTDPDTIQIGPATQGQFAVILVEQANDLISVFDTVLNQDVTNIFIATDNVRNITDPTHDITNVPFKSYVLGPLNAGFNETYVLNFS